MTSIVLKSPAKINLYLQILNKRPDGFHNINTLFEKINLFDTITMRILKNDRNIQIRCGHPDVPQDKNNIAYKAAEFLQNKFKLKNGVAITIKKRIPVAAGLGGGSSNAAAVFEGINRLFHLALTKKQLMGYAENIGADVPFFLSGCSFAWATAKGTEITPLDIKNKFWHILSVPNIHISTKEVYQSWSKPKNNLTNKKFSANIWCSVLQHNNIEWLKDNCSNSLETIVLKQYEQVKRLKELLINLGLKMALMSGSGPSVFGIVATRKEAVSLSSELCKNYNYHTFVVRTYE